MRASSMGDLIKNIVIVGGGSAGWLTAGTLAAEHMANSLSGISITLVESPDVNAIGVGEGTWPTMQSTLKRMGISESDFFRECDVSFKQGSKFVHWTTGEKNDAYYHSFTLPQGFSEINLAPYWQLNKDKISFCNAVCAQGVLCDNFLAPKQKTTPEYAYVANYGYHLDAVKFAAFLKRHCVEKLGVKHILDHVTGINSAENNDIISISTTKNGNIPGDLFVDCTGFSSLLLGQHYDVPFLSKKDILFIDTALAIQVPYSDSNSPIASATISTAQDAGWIWDIGLPSRRGVGYVYSSAHSSEMDAESTLRKYIEPSLGKKSETVDLRKIPIVSGHRKKFWHRNCVAIGLSAGFLEPLEASALVLIELSASTLSEQLPATRESMDIVAKRFNEKFLHHWNNLIDFLKLHYILSQREMPFWRDNSKKETIPDSLQEQVHLWKYHHPWHSDFLRKEELFSVASYQYVLYGMGFETQARATKRRSDNPQMAYDHFSKNAERTKQLLGALPTNRELIEHIRQYGMHKI